MTPLIPAWVLLMAAVSAWLWLWDANRITWPRRLVLGVVIGSVLAVAGAMW